jgi:hypothetical protein
MKNLLFVFALLSLMTGFFSCDLDDLDCIRVSDQVITRDWELGDFTDVVFTGVGNIVVTQGSATAFRATGPDNVLAEMTTEVFNGQLVIGFRKCFNGEYDLNIEITMPEVEELSLVGVGSIESADTLRCEDLRVKLTGVGSIDLLVMGANINSQISGVGQLQYAGSCEKHVVASSGQVELKAYDLEALDYELTVLGVADHYISAANSIEALITGTGNIYYRGNPTVNRSGNGAGQVINTD